MTRRHYDSDLTDVQWAVFAKILPKPKKNWTETHRQKMVDRRHPLRRSHRLPMAKSAARLSEMENSVQ